MEPNVDFVFPYLNPADEKWQKIYEYCTGKKYTDTARFRDFSLLKYIFRSIELYAPWINRVNVIVQSESQIPDFLNKNSFRIILHEEFIPKEYLPVFNSNTIEMFLSKITGLNEYVLYSNDDFIFFNPCVKKDFFEKGILKYSYRMRQAAKSDFVKLCERTFNLVRSKCNFPKNPKYEFLKQHHGAAVPLLFSDMKKCYDLLEPEILDSLTMFRNLDRNLNQYMYAYYSFCKFHTEPMRPEYIGTYFSKEDSGSIKSLNFNLRNCKSKMICINDTEKMTKDFMKAVYDFLEIKFPNKSRFEI